MHIQVGQSLFLKLLQRQQGVIERKSTVSLLSHALLEAEKGKDGGEGVLRIIGTDLELTLVETCPADVKEAGMFTVSAHLLHDIVKKCPSNQSITLIYDGKTLSLVCGPSSFSLPTLPVDGYPPVAVHEPTHSFILTGGELRRLIDQTRFAMSTEEARFYLNGMYVHASGDALKAVATDAHRLALSWVPLPPNASGVRGMIWSRKTVAEVRKLIESDDVEMHVSFSSAQAAFSYEGLTFYARFVNGVFPQYEDAIPKENRIVLQVLRESFHEAVDRVSVIAAQDKVRPVCLSVSKEKISLSAKGADNGSGIEEVAVKYDGEPFSIHFNARYVLDALQQVKGKHFTLHFKDSKTPVLLKDEADDQVLYVLMPVRASV